MLSNYLLDQDEFDDVPGVQEEFSEKLREMQQHPLFCDYADLDRFARQGIGETFHLDDEDEIMTLNRARPGDTLYIPDKEWTRSKMGSYEELKLGGQAIYRDTNDSATGGGEWLVTKRDSFGMKVELHRADMSPEISSTESSSEESTLRVEIEEVVNWCEDILRGLDDYMHTGALGGMVSEKIGSKVSVYLKEHGEGKFTDFLRGSRIGHMLHFRGPEANPTEYVKLMDSGLSPKLMDSGLPPKLMDSGLPPKFLLLQVPASPIHTAKCIEVLSDQLAINSQWYPSVISKQVRAILVSEGIAQQTNKLRILAWKITVGSFIRSEEINNNKGSEIDVSPEKLLDVHYNWLKEISHKYNYNPSKRVAFEAELKNWKEVVEQYLNPSGERLVALPEIKKIDYNSHTVPELMAKCKERGIKGYSKLKKAELIARLKESPSD